MSNTFKVWFAGDEDSAEYITVPRGYAGTVLDAAELFCRKRYVSDDYGFQCHSVDVFAEDRRGVVKKIGVLVSFRPEYTAAFY